MKWEWIQTEAGWLIRHTTNAGDVIEVSEADFAAYLAALHMSEKQEPVPPRPADPVDTAPPAAAADPLAVSTEAVAAAANVTAMAGAAADPAVVAAAEQKPDAIATAIQDALARTIAAKDMAEQFAIDAQAAAAAAQGNLDVMKKLVTDLSALAVMPDPAAQVNEFARLAPLDKPL